MSYRGERIRNRRDELGLNLRQAADHCGVDASTLSRLETDKMPRVSFDILSKVAKGLGLNLDDLAEDAPLPRKLEAGANQVVGAKMLVQNVS